MLAHEQSRGSLIRQLPWIEATGTLGGALFFYFVLHKAELAEFFAILGGIVTLSRLSHAADLEREFAAIRRPLIHLEQQIDLASHTHFTVFREILEVYSKITETEFAKVKDDILKDARARLLRLANDKKSEVLTTTTYYGWLLPMLARSAPPSRIWALSLMREPEWDDTQPERTFIEQSRKAAERGVQIDRVFVVPRANASAMLTIPAVVLHRDSEDPTHLRGYVVEEEVLKRDDADLHSKLGDGFIVFDDRVALVDVFSGASVRGYVTMSPVEIGHLKDVFERLRILAEDLDSYSGRLEASRARTDVKEPPGASSRSSSSPSLPNSEISN